MNNNNIMMLIILINLGIIFWCLWISYHKNILDQIEHVLEQKMSVKVI